MIRIKDVISSGLNEDYPEKFDKQEFNSIKSFQGKLDYAVKHLSRIASGSSRVVFTIDDKKVLKIAKNKKGLAQNKTESDKYLENYDIVAKVFDSDRNDFWLEMEIAKKLSPKRFQAITGVSIEDVDKYMRYEHKRNHGRTPTQWETPDPEKLDQLNNNEFLIDLTSLMNDMDMPAGDLGRISSFGEVIRNGKPTVVLIDFGLSQEVYDDFYRVK